MGVFKLKLKENTYSIIKQIWVCDSKNTYQYIIQIPPWLLNCQNPINKQTNKKTYEKAQTLPWNREL